MIFIELKHHDLKPCLTSIPFLWENFHKSHFIDDQSFCNGMLNTTFTLFSDSFFPCSSSNATSRDMAIKLTPSQQNVAHSMYNVSLLMAQKQLKY